MNNEFSDESKAELLNDLIKRLKADKEAIEAKIKLAENLLSSCSPTGQSKPKRSPRGQNRQQIKEYLEQHSTDKIKVEDIEKALNIKRTSVWGS